MNPALLAVIWLSAGAAVTMLAGRGIARGQRGPAPVAAPPASSTPTPMPTPAVRSYVRLDLADLALAAHQSATADLLATRPASIRRVSTA